MTEAILYSFRRCPYAMRARMALHVSGLAYEHREVVLRDKPPEMLEVSPKGTVPVIVDAEAGVLEESLDIMRWALRHRDPENWLKRQDDELLAANDGPFKHHLDRYKYSTRYDDVDPEEHGAKAVEHLRVMEERLTMAPYLCGETRGFTDIAVFPFVRQFVNTDKAWFAAQGLEGITAWLKSLTGSDLFTAIMAKHVQWKAG